MPDSFVHGPLLWYLNRGTGVSLLILFTSSIALGILSARPGRRRLVPTFVTQQLHRNLSLLALALLGAHITTAVVDTYVDIRWWQALSPYGATYKPFWLGLGSLTCDIMIVVMVTSLLRRRLGHRAWHAVHLLGYAAWPIAFVHGAGIGTDASTSWGRWIGIGCVGALAIAGAIRLAAEGRARRAPEGTAHALRTASARPVGGV